MNRSAQIAVALAAVLMAAAAGWLALRNDSAPEPGPAPVVPDRAPETRHEATGIVNLQKKKPVRKTAASSEPATGPQPSTLLYTPDSGPIIPFDITNLASDSLGASLWIQFTNNEGEWHDLWRALHAGEPRREQALEDPPEPPPFDGRTEAILAIGLGTRERMDYGFTLEPVAPKLKEHRYRLKIVTVATPPVEVVTRPARVWLVPTDTLGEEGLILEDENGNEIRRFARPQPPVEETDPVDDEDVDEEK